MRDLEYVDSLGMMPVYCWCGRKQGNASVEDISVGKTFFCDSGCMIRYTSRGVKHRHEWYETDEEGA